MENELPLPEWSKDHIETAKYRFAVLLGLDLVEELRKLDNPREFITRSVTRLLSSQV